MDKSDLLNLEEIFKKLTENEYEYLMELLEKCIDYEASKFYYDTTNENNHIKPKVYTSECIKLLLDTVPDVILWDDSNNQSIFEFIVDIQDSQNIEYIINILEDNNKTIYDIPIFSSNKILPIEYIIKNGNPDMIKCVMTHLKNIDKYNFIEILNYLSKTEDREIFSINTYHNNIDDFVSYITEINLFLQ